MAHATLYDLTSRTGPGNTAMAEGGKKKWIQKAIKPENRGKFRAKAERAGESTAEFAREHKDDKGTTGKQARLALTLMGMNKRKKSPLYDHPRSQRS